MGVEGEHAVADDKRTAEFCDERHKNLDERIEHIDDTLSNHVTELNGKLDKLKTRMNQLIISVLSFTVVTLLGLIIWIIKVFWESALRLIL